MLLILELVVYIYSLGMIIFLTLENKSWYTQDQTWNLVWFTFVLLHMTIIPIVGTLSARHINKHSASVERLGIRTNSLVLKFYLAFWISLSATCILIGIALLYTTVR